jgi:hypothetical protein
MSGKGSSPRPFSISREQYSSNWDVVFNKEKIEDNTGVQKNEYYDIISTEDCFDVEDPDPDKRSWYYDEYGVKRKKK